MKNKNTFLLVLCCLLLIDLFSCHKEKNEGGYCTETIRFNQELFEAGLQEFGWAKAVKGDVNIWEASAIWWPRQEDSLHWVLSMGTCEELFEQACAPRESIVLDEIPYAKGVYQVSGLDDWDGIVDGGYARLGEDGDAVMFYYSTNDMKYSWIEITDIDPENKIMRGIFELHFGPTECLDLQVDIVEGCFEARMYE